MPLKILPRKCMSVAKEGKVFEPKKLLQPLLDTSEGTKITWISLFLTSPTPTVYSTVQSPLSPVCSLQCPLCTVQSETVLGQLKRLESIAFAFLNNTQLHCQ